MKPTLIHLDKIADLPTDFPCADCDGEGYRTNGKCSTCDGSGEVLMRWNFSAPLDAEKALAFAAHHSRKYVYHFIAKSGAGIAYIAATNVYDRMIIPPEIIDAEPEPATQE